MEKVIEYLPIILQSLGALTIVATVLVRLTPSPADDADIKRYSESIWRLIAWLPTIGVNPQTDRLKKAYDALSSDKPAS